MNYFLGTLNDTMLTKCALFLPHDENLEFTLYCRWNYALSHYLSGTPVHVLGLINYVRET